MLNEAQIFCIHPINKDLRFLLRLIRSLRKKYPQTIKYLKLLNNRLSHTRCLELLARREDDLVILLCHGYEGCILGCDFPQGELDSTEWYRHGSLISGSTVGNLDKKKIIAFCCYSNSIVKLAVASGAKVAMGFECIRFDYLKNIQIGVTYPKIQKSVKFEIRSFLHDSITHAIDNKLSFEELEYYMRLILNRRHSSILQSRKKHKREIASILLEIKHGIKLFGDRKLTVF